MEKPIWVVKIGSQSLVDGGFRLINKLMKEVSSLSDDYTMAWVSSGAIATAKEFFNSGKNQYGSSLVSEKQALSAIGQPKLYSLYERALKKQRLTSAQILLSASDLKNENQRLNFLATIENLFHWQCIPIINENDAVATDEIHFGDNDQLAALISAELSAARLTLLSNVDGLLDEEGKVVSKIDRIENRHLDMVNTSSSKSGTGGMVSKLKAAQIATRAGVITDIANAHESGVLGKIASGRHTGTEIRSAAQNPARSKDVRQDQPT